MPRLAALSLSIGALVVLLVTAACGERLASTESANTSDASAGVYTIVATTGMVTDLVSRVAGERAEVVGLMDAGVDPHLYQPTRSDVRRVLDADVIFANGLLLEGKMTGALDRAAAAGKPVYAVAELLDDEMLLEPPGFDGAHDPHVWMDPIAWAAAAEDVRDALVEFDPEHESEYRANAEAYRGELERLHEYAVEVLASVPERQRVLVTAHDAFNYFGERYGYEVIGIQGISTESEAGVREIEDLVDLIVRRNVAAVFVESTVSDRNINALIAGAGSRGHRVSIGGELFSDAMGGAGTYEGTYIGMIDHNVTTIARALGGDAPKRGMNGALAE
jgi:manganese/zinc/iron transport system substrate-binding protein